MRRTTLSGRSKCYLGAVSSRSSFAILAYFSIFLCSTWCSSAARGETYDLNPAKFDAQTQQVHVDYQVEGDLKLNPDGKGVRRLPMTVKATLFYDEQLKSAAKPLRAARYYRLAEADIQIDKSKLRPSLDDEKRFIALYTENSRWTMLSPVGHLTRDELDLIEVPGNSAAIHQLLPSGQQKIDAQWKHEDSVLAQLLNLQAVTESDVKSQLKEVKDGVALIELTGSLSGAAEGVATDIDLSAKYNFDLKRKAITWFAIAIREKRSVGHAVPGFEAVAQLRMQMRPIAESKFVNDRAFPKVDEKPSDDSQWLAYESPEHGFRCLHDRRWQVMGAGPQVIVLRMVDQGDLIAQCNVSKLSDSDSKNMLPLKKYQADIQQALGKHFAQFVEASQQMTANNLRMLRVVASGTVSEVPMQWFYYHVSDEQGRRVSTIVTVEDKLAERLQGTDSVLANTMELFDPPAKSKQETAKKPSSTARR